MKRTPIRLTLRPMTVAAKLAPRTASWWEDEVQNLVSLGPFFTPAARRMVRQVLLTLLEEPLTDPERSEILMLLRRLGRPTLVPSRWVSSR